MMSQGELRLHLINLGKFYNTDSIGVVSYYAAFFFLPSVVGLHFPHTDQKPAHYFTRRLQIVLYNVCE